MTHSDYHNPLLKGRDQSEWNRPVEGGYQSAFSSHCGDQRSFLFLFGRHLGIILFPLPLTPAD
jgi:hypothetical protein